jgi:hypothetical protein
MRGSTSNIPSRIIKVKYRASRFAETLTNSLKLREFILMNGLNFLRW